MNINNLELILDEGPIQLLELKNQFEFTLYYKTESFEGWEPPISDLTVKSAYYVKYSPTNVDSIGTMKLTGVPQTDVSINLAIGWNWIGYPLENSTDINNIINDNELTHKLVYDYRFSQLVFVDKKLDIEEHIKNIVKVCGFYYRS